jgi:hypothetical protein
MYITSDHRTFSSKVAAYRHEAMVNPNPELRRYYSEEADKCIRKQRSPLGKLFSIPFIPLAIVVHMLSGNSPLQPIKNLLED